MPILIGSSPRAETMNGAAMTWLAPSAMPAFGGVRDGVHGVLDYPRVEYPAVLGARRVELFPS